MSETPDPEGARVGLRDMLATPCDCSESWTGRNRHAPDCRYQFIHDFLDDDEIASVNAAARPSPAEPPAGDLREALETMASRWEHEADDRIADPKASGASLLAVGILRNHAQSVRAALLATVRSTTPPEPEDGGT